MKHLHLCLAAAATLAMVAPARANIVANPSFECGTSPWVSVLGGGGNDPWSVQPGTGHTGTHLMLTGCSIASCADPNTGARFYQDLTTVVGTVYDLTFWIQSTGGPPDEYRVYWDGTLVDDIVNQPFTNNFVQFTVNALTVTSTTTRLLFTGFQGPGIVEVDDVDVEARANVATPEPATLALLGLGLAGLGVVRRKRAAGRADA